MSKPIKSFNDYQEVYKESITSPEAFWAGVAEDFQWRKKWNKVLEWDFNKPDVKWFTGGKLNITENCLDRHLDKLGDKPAIIWEPNDPTEGNRIISYGKLHQKTM